MDPCQRSRILLPFVAFLLAAPVAAQDALNWAELTGTCTVSGAELAAELAIVAGLPAAWVGWVVIRTTLGMCEPAVRVHGPVAFPAEGRRTYTFSDPTDQPGLAYEYRIRAVDAGGNWLNLASGGSFPPAHYQSAYTACGDAVVVRGRLVGGVWMTGVEVCPDQCWVPVQFVSELPAALAPLVDTTAVVELRGTRTDEFEGPYVTGVTGWTVLADCGTVPAVPGNWSGLKAAYR